MSRLRVLQVYRDHFTEVPGGIERHVRELAWGLGPEFEVEVLASARGRRAREFQDGPSKVHLVSEIARPGGIPLWRGAARVIRDGSFDLVHLHVPNPTGEYVHSAVGDDVPYVVTYHADVHRNPRIARIYLRHLKRTLDAARTVIVSSNELVAASPVLSVLPQPERIEVVPFGVDIERFSPGITNGSRAFRDRWGPRPVVLFLGRLRHYKGVDLLIEAVAASEGVVLVVGGDGPERIRITALGTELLGDRFHHLPDVSEDDLPDLYRAADVFCLPSTKPAETFGISVLEAMASGLPAITTELGTATSTINAAGTTGEVVPPGTSDALRTAIERILGDEPRRDAMATAARERVVSMYDREQMLNRIRALYGRAADRSN